MKKNIRKQTFALALILACFCLGSCSLFRKGAKNKDCDCSRWSKTEQVKTASDEQPA